MKAAVFYESEKIQLENVPEPRIGDDEVLIEVKACGFCGSDIEYYYGRSPLLTPSGKGPLILGHELSGVVAEVGSLPKALGLYKAGDRVAVSPVQYCNACESCTKGQPMFCKNMRVLGVTHNGGFAQYVSSKYSHLYKLPDQVSFEQGAFVEMLAASVNAVEELEIFPGAFVLIMGPGPVGLAMIQLARLHGAGKVAIAGTRDYRLEVAEKLGADFIWNVNQKGSPHYTSDLVKSVQEVTDGKLADRVVVPTSSPEANQQALEVSGNGSVVVYFGLASPQDKVEVPLLKSLYQAKKIKFSLLYPYQWPKTVALIANQKVKTEDIITHHEPLENISQAIERVVKRQDNVIKSVIKP